MFKKTLKKIPADLVAYIQIETEAIQDANDKMMISSYCLSKLEMVRDRLMACHKTITAVKVTNFPRTSAYQLIVPHR